MSDLVERLRTSWDVDRSIISQTSGWDKERKEAADEITALRARLEAVEKERDAIGRDLNRAKYGEPDFAWSTHLTVLDETIVRAERAEAALATARRENDNG